MDKSIFNINTQSPPKLSEKLPIFVSRDMLDEMKKYLPYKLYDAIELNYELGFMHHMLGDTKYKEEVDVIIKAKRALSCVPEIDYKIKHK